MPRARPPTRSKRFSAGFAKISDCSYVDVGVSALYNAKKDMILTTVVLAA